VRGEIFAQRSAIQRESLLLQLVETLGGDQQDRLAWPAVDLRMGVPVACNTQRGNDPVRNRTLGDAAGRNVDLENGCGGHLYLSYRRKVPSAQRAACTPDYRFAHAALRCAR